MISIIHHLLSVLILANYVSAKQINNLSKLKKTEAKAVKLPTGIYYIQNVATKDWLYYQAKPHQNIFPHTTAAPIKITNIKGKEHILHPTQSDNKCLSAQWGYSTLDGVDHAMVVYQCGLSSKQLATNNKQAWMLLPAKQARRKRRQHELLLDTRRINSAEESELEKRKASQRKKIGVFNIVSYDHATDMAFRALHSSDLITAGSSRSTSLRGFEPNNSEQQWIVYRQL